MRVLHDAEALRIPVHDASAQLVDRLWALDPESLPDRPRNALVGVLDLLAHYLHVGGPAGQELDAELCRTALQGQARAWTLTRLLKPRPLRTLFGDLKDAQRSVGALRRALAFDTHPTLIDGRVREFLLEVAGRCAKDPAELLAQVEAEPAEVASEITPAQWRFFALTNAGEVRWAASRLQRGAGRLAEAERLLELADRAYVAAEPALAGDLRSVQNWLRLVPGWAQVLIELASSEPPAREPADVVRLLDRLPPPASLHRDAEAFVAGRLAEALHLAGEPEHARAVLETVVTRHDHHHPAWVQLLTYLVENVGDADLVADARDRWIAATGGRQQSVDWIRWAAASSACTEHGRSRRRFC